MLQSGSDICINGYDFVCSEGNGSIGSVFRARKDRKLYALKMININQIENLNNFVLLMQKLLQTDASNQNVVKINEFFQIPLTFFIVMEYCNQGNLMQYMCKQPGCCLNCFKAIELFAEILNGFKFLHQNNIEHRNLKPQNILIHNDRPKITDYGIYMIYNGKEDRYQMREFMAPENYEQQPDEITHLCDIWGLGILFFFMLFGTWPFKDFEDIKKYTYKRSFDLPSFINEKNIDLPPSLKNISNDLFEMISEIMKGVFSYESKNRITFSQLCKHRIFLKIKTFNMEESFLFYLQAEKTFVRNNPIHKNSFQKNSIMNLVGLPGVSARSMYSGEIQEEHNNDRISLNVSIPLINIKRVTSKRSSTVNQNMANINECEALDVAQDLSVIDINEQAPLSPGQDLALGTNLGNVYPKLQLQVTSYNHIVKSVTSDFSNDTPVKNRISSKGEKTKSQTFFNKIVPDVDYYEGQGGTHFSPQMLSSFGKKTLKNKKNFEAYSSLQNSPVKQSNQQESESDFDNIEEFDSFHKEVNYIPEFCILKACKMVDFQFKLNQDPTYLKQVDSYCLSSVISIPRPFSYQDTSEIQRNHISTLYDLEIYRYRFIEETIRLIKNINFEQLLPIFDYSSLILAEYISLKMCFYLVKSLLIKIQRNQNFLKIDSNDFTKFISNNYHLKFIDILQKDQERLFSQFYLSQTLIQNQGFHLNIEKNEANFFFVDNNLTNHLQEVPSSFEESDRRHHPFSGNAIQTKESSVQRTQLQETPSFSINPCPPHASLNVDQLKPMSSRYQNQNSILEPNQNRWEHLKEGMTFSIVKSSELEEKYVTELNNMFEKQITSIYEKLKDNYQSNSNSETSLKFLKLALRISMCLRHKDVFDKNKMESILIFFESSSNSSSNATSHILSFVPNQNNIIQQQFKGSGGGSLGTSLSASNFLKPSKKGGHQFSVESLVKWINSCSKQDVLRQISILIEEQVFND